MNNQKSKAALLFWTLLVTVTIYHTKAFAQENGLTPEHVSEIKQVTSAVISPDGRHVAYTLLIQADPLQSNIGASHHLYIADTKRGESESLYTSGSVGSVQFRPDHGTITFIAFQEGDEQNALYQLSTDGGDAEEIFRFETSISSYRWAPDGNTLAFTANEPIETVVTSLPYEPEVVEEGLVHRRGYIANVEEDAEPLQIQAEGSIYQLSWSPDGQRLAISETPTPAIDDFYMFQQVRTVDTNGRVVSEIDNEGKLGQIEWSPDGQNLALRAGDDINDPIDGRIMVVSADGGTPENIFPDFEGSFRQIQWTGDDTIHFLASEGAKTSFGTIHPDGSGLNREIPAGDPAHTSFSKSDDNVFSFTTGSPLHPTEIYLKEGSGEAHRLTNSNEWLDNITLGEQEIIRYEARDGLEIEGLLIRPVDYSDGTAYPLIVVVHGGPEAHYSNSWITAYSLPGQMAAADGYAVFYPNYRGSTGRGLDFVKTSQSDAGGAEFDDIVDGVDYLIDEGIADGDRVGVTGGSYGGYATAWMSTYYSERFAAGVMNVGVSNNISKWGTSDIPNELYLVHSLEWLWDNNNWQKYLERSPIYHVDNTQTALLIAHGKEDTRVHPGQSLELHRHIKVRRPDVPLRLVLYPNEGHGYSRATARYDYNLRMMQWFDRYLKSDDETLPDSVIMPE